MLTKKKKRHSVQSQIQKQFVIFKVSKREKNINEFVTLKLAMNKHVSFLENSCRMEIRSVGVDVEIVEFYLEYDWPGGCLAFQCFEYLNVFV